MFDQTIFWIGVYMLGSFGTLYFGMKVKELTGDEFPLWMIWSVAILWFIFMPPALFNVMSGKD